MKTIVHPSQSPILIESERAACLRQRKVAAKFHYETHRQATLWLKLHERYAPPADMAQPYADAAKALSLKWPHLDGSLIALGCGGGEKDVSILKALPGSTHFVPTDVCEHLALKAAQSAAKTHSSSVETPLVFDLTTADNLLNFIDQHAGLNRIYTFFGIIPNFPPKDILPRLRLLLRNEDFLLVSANLAPDSIEAILSQYDNDTTRKWLSEFPKSHGAGEGEVKITVESDGNLQYICAYYHFQESCTMKANGEIFKFRSKDVLQLFVSYRYTIDSLTNALKSHGIDVKQFFQSANREEGVFLCKPQ